jgi:hypothetical protein
VASKRPPRGGNKSKKAARRQAKSEAAQRGWQTRRDNRAAVSWNEFGRDFPGYYHGRRDSDGKREKEARRRRGDEEDDYNEGPVWDDDWEWNY